MHNQYAYVMVELGSVGLLLLLALFGCCFSCVCSAIQIQILATVGRRVPPVRGEGTGMGPVSGTAAAVGESESEHASISLIDLDATSLIDLDAIVHPVLHFVSSAAISSNAYRGVPERVVNLWLASGV